MIKFARIPPNIHQRIPEIKESLSQESKIVFAYLVGSLAKGVQGTLSDIDIAVYLNTTEDLAGYKLDLFNKLTDALGTAELDLIILNTAPISLVGRILQNKQLLIDKDPFRRHLYESLALREFFDFKNKENTYFSLRYGIGR